MATPPPNTSRGTWIDMLPVTAIGSDGSKTQLRRRQVPDFNAEVEGISGNLRETSVELNSYVGKSPKLWENRGSPVDSDQSPYVWRVGQ